MQVFTKVQRDKLTSNVILRNIMTLTTYELIWQWTTFSPSAVSFSFNQVFYSDLPLSSFLKETWLWTPKLFFFLLKHLKTCCRNYRALQMAIKMMVFSHVNELSVIHLEMQRLISLLSELKSYDEHFRVNIYYKLNFLYIAPKHHNSYLKVMYIVS